jgi:hypothetical protein
LLFASSERNFPDSHEIAETFIKGNAILPKVLFTDMLWICLSEGIILGVVTSQKVLLLLWETQNLWY